MNIVYNGCGDRRASIAGLLRTAAAVGCLLLVCGCNTDQQITGAPTVPTDYRLRHPITIAEKDRTFQLFIGAHRDSLTASQRAELLAFAASWKSVATGGVVIALPVGSSNTNSSAGALPEIESILAASGVPRQSMAVRNYRVSPDTLATVRVSYPRIAAQAGPCGLWPEDLGPSLNRDYSENQPPWDFGCATQRNLAAMVADPADLVQPRAETPAYTMRRTTVMEQYRAGKDTGTQYANPNAGKIA
ncbi:MAG: CpaD family pilus assembly protein, partial [Xanthobacteraceae bacterium]